MLFATVVLFIGLLNLLPFPPLDGGHVAIALIEKVRGKRIDMKKVVPVSAVVLLILGFFSISAMILDVWKPIQSGPSGPRYPPDLQERPEGRHSFSIRPPPARNLGRVRCRP